MKKKFMAVGLIALAAVSFGGCASRGAAISEEVINADPWVEYDTIEEIQELAGFEIAYPETLGDNKKSDISYYYIEGINEIEIRYDEDANDYIRKAKDDGDISGDYQEYAYEAEVEIDGRTVTFKGESEESIAVAVWNVDDFSYCVRVADGLSADDMTEAVSAVE